jgi:hypothetical protein
MHEHTEPKKCKHELNHCTHCDMVYCEKCKEEWENQSKKYKLPEYFPWKKKPFYEEYKLCNHDKRWQA